MSTPQLDDPARRTALTEAEDKALTLFDAIEVAGIIAPGRSETEVDADINALAQSELGIARHWHTCNVRVGANTATTFHDSPPVRVIAPDDTVYVDLGPVFEAWEADVGRTYVVGDDAAKHALVAALPVVFEAVRAQWLGAPDMTGAALYAQHCVACHWPGDKDYQRISPLNPMRLTDADPFGRPRHWILEIHLLEPERQWGGFYERLLRKS